MKLTKKKLKLIIEETIGQDLARWSAEEAERSAREQINDSDSFLNRHLDSILDIAAKETEEHDPEISEALRDPQNRIEVLEGGLAGVITIFNESEIESAIAAGIDDQAAKLDIDELYINRKNAPKWIIELGKILLVKNVRKTASEILNNDRKYPTWYKKGFRLFTYLGNYARNRYNEPKPSGFTGWLWNLL